MWIYVYFDLLIFLILSHTKNTLICFQCVQILKLFERCRKFETEEEKILPFCVNSLTSEEMEELQRNDMEPPIEPLAKVRFIWCLRFSHKMNGVISSWAHPKFFHFVIIIKLCW